MNQFLLGEVFSVFVLFDLVLYISEANPINARKGAPNKVPGTVYYSWFTYF